MQLAFEKERQRESKLQEKLVSIGHDSLANVDKPKNRSSPRDRAAGVAVLRTIVRQNQKKARCGEVAKFQDYDTNQEDNASKRVKDNENLEVKARRYIEYAAFLYGHPEALVYLGNEALEKARLGEENSDSSFDDNYIHIRGAGQGIINSGQENLEFFRRELSELSSWRRAEKLYHMAGKRGSKEAWFNLGNMLWNGLSFINDNDDTTSKNISIEPDTIAAVHAFSEAIKLGDADATYFLGVQYLSSEQSTSLPNLPDMFGISSETSKMKGLNLVRKAAIDFGHGGALHYLALFYRHGDESLSLLPCSNEIFREYLDASCDAKYSDALFIRAHCYYHGEDGFTQDFEKALQGFLEATKAGNADAAVSAGAMYFKGGFNGKVERDQRRAFELYQTAAEMGSREGWMNLVACYALGEGVPKCEKTAKYIAKVMLNLEEIF
eukprot:CAMPEP_0184866820 /NCGR_PEP_ID=MMETSP0580-20130426/23893_1 /TAXON_ID=1118495 /ORGANISM="Dactyliosolen fragilissimus" /LENGTH=437 /DNA_ID=CAMNT_0027366711 /DNA_START=346 /DNA_END=1659 /DNA_ORIENTATION=+